jgi:VWFA-related protein
MRQRRVRLSAAVLAGLTFAAVAQAQSPSRQVDVLAVDREGRPAAGLAADDFELREKGRVQKVVDVRYVAPADAPRTTVFVVDDIGMSFQSAVFVKQALAKFADEQMRGDDRVTLVRTYSTYSGIDTEHTLSADKKRFRESVERVRYNTVQRGPRTSSYDIRYDTSMQASLECLRSVVRDLGKVPGRKSVVFFSDGLHGVADPFIDPAVRVPIDETIDAANRASIVIYTVDARGLPSPLGPGWYAPRREAEHRALHMLARETGGVFLWNTDVTRALGRIMASEGGYYLLSYEPAVAPSAQPVDIEVKVKRSGVKARTRSSV